VFIRQADYKKQTDVIILHVPFTKEKQSITVLLFNGYLQKMSTDLHDVANLLLTKLNVDNVFGSQ
jgi:hypothetical protein